MSTPRNPKLAPEVLKLHGITYDSAVYNYDSETLPIHVNIVREGLLDFESFLIRDRTRQALRDTGHNHNDIPDSAFKSGGGIESSELETQSKFIMMAVKISDAVQTLQFDQSLENSWQALLNRTVFEQKSYPVSKRYNILNIQSAKQIACVCDGTVKWNEAHSIRNLNKYYPLPSIPTPDIYFGYTIYDSTQYTSYGFAKDNFIGNFTIETLYRLTGKGLCSAVTSGFASYLTDRLKPGNERSAIPRHNLLCFPWAIVELKRFKEGNERTPTTQVYCQAANAGSAALCILENLAKFAKVKQHNQHIPPIVTITCVGGETKIWLAYSRYTIDNQRDHRMVCIWEGSLCKIWDAIQFCRITDNLFAWAQYILRPKVSQYIDQWREQHHAGIHDLRFRLEDDPKISSIVHQVERRLRSMNIPASHNIPSLVPLVVTLQEVITATEKEITPREGITESDQSKLPSAYMQSPKAPHPTTLSIISEEQNVMNSAIGDVDANLDIVRSTWPRLSLGPQEIKSPFKNTDSGGSPSTLSAGFDQNHQTSNATTGVRGSSAQAGFKPIEKQREDIPGAVVITPSKVSIKESENSSTSMHFTPSRTELHSSSSHGKSSSMRYAENPSPEHRSGSYDGGQKLGIFSSTSKPIFNGTSTPLFGDTSKPLFGDTSKPLFGDTSKPLFGNTSKPLFGNTSKPLFNFAADADKGELFKLKPINDALPTKHDYAEKQSKVKHSPTSARPGSKALGSAPGSLGKDHAIVTKTSTLVGMNGFGTSHIEQRSDATNKVPVVSHTVDAVLRQTDALLLNDRMRKVAAKEVRNKEQENLQRGNDRPRPRIKIPFRGYSVWSGKYTGLPKYKTGVIVRLPPAKKEYEKNARKSPIFKDSITFSQFTQQLGQSEKDESPKTAHVEVVEINDDKWEDIDSDEEDVGSGEDHTDSGEEYIDSNQEDIDSDEESGGSGGEHIDSDEENVNSDEEHIDSDEEDINSDEYEPK